MTAYPKDDGGAQAGVLNDPGLDLNPRHAPYESRVKIAKKSRADQRETSRQRLLEAGRALCSEGRFLTCSVAEVAAKAALSRAAFYLHFDGKEDLLGTVLSDQLAWYVKQYDIVSQKNFETKSEIVAWLSQFIDGFRTAGELLVLFWMSTPTREIVRRHHENRLRAAEVIGHRIPRLKMFRKDGSLNIERRCDIILFMYQLEQVCMNIAFGAEQLPDENNQILYVLAGKFQLLLS